MNKAHGLERVIGKKQGVLKNIILCFCLLILMGTFLGILLSTNVPIKVSADTQAYLHTNWKTPINNKGIANNKIESIVFTSVQPTGNFDSIVNIGASSVAGTGEFTDSIKAYIKNKDIIVYSSATIYAPQDSSYFFSSSTVKDDSTKRPTNLKTITFNNFNTSEVTNMGAMFIYCSSLESLNLSGFNTKNVTAINQMFQYCSSLKSITFGDDFDTSKTKSFLNLFYSCSTLKELDLSKFNTRDVTTMHQMFQDCSSLETIKFGDDFNTSKVENMLRMFKGCEKLKGLDLRNHFYTENVLTMQEMFQNCKSLKSLDVLGFNTEKVSCMSSMFYGLESITSLNLSSFNTEIVSDMGYMFDLCTNLTTLNLSSFNTGAVQTMKSMFNGCYALTTIDFGDNFNTSSVTDMSYMFLNCKALESITFGDKFSTTKVTTMSDMFNGCKALAELDLSKFAISGSCNVTNMLVNMSNLKTIIAPQTLKRSLGLPNKNFINIGNSARTLTNTITTQEAGKTFKKAYTITARSNGGKFSSSTGWTESSTTLTKLILHDEPIGALPTATYTGYTFDGWFTDKTDGDEITDQSYFTSHASIYPHWTLIGKVYLNKNWKKAINDAGLSNGNITSVRFTTAVQSGIGIDVGATSVDGTGAFTDTIQAYINNTGIVITSASTIYAPKDSSYLFSSSTDSLSSLLTLTLVNFDTSEVTDMSKMFFNCIKLTSINFGNSFKTSEVTDMKGLFQQCQAIKTIALGDDFDTKEVTNMSKMFLDCSLLTNVTFGNNFSTIKVEDMSDMFAGCEKLTTMNLSCFNTSIVTNISKMFYNCGLLTEIVFGDNFSTNDVTNTSGMFEGCSSLTALDLSTFTIKSNCSVDNMLSGCSSLKTLIAPKQISKTLTLPANNFVDTKVAIRTYIDKVGTATESKIYKKAYTVTLKVEGGTISDIGTWTVGTDNTSATRIILWNEEEVSFPTVASNNLGYTIAGWFDNKVGGEEQTDLTGLVKDLTLYSQWRLSTSTIKLGTLTNISKIEYSIDNTNWTELTLDGFVANANTDYYFKATAQDITGYTIAFTNFADWFTDTTNPSSAHSFTENAQIYTVGATASKTANIYLVGAVVKSNSAENPNDYSYTGEDMNNTVQINTSSATGVADINAELSAEFESQITLVATAGKGYTFVGWFDNENLTGTAVSIDSKYELTVGAEDKIYYAKFVANTLIIIKVIIAVACVLAVIIVFFIIKKIKSAKR